MGNLKCIRKPNIILVPYPAQGHVTPMLKLASSLLHLKFHPIIVIPEFIHHSIISNYESNDKITFMSIPDGLNKGASGDFFTIENAMENTMPLHLEQLIHKLEGQVVCMVVDLLASWAIQVANRCEIAVAGFWPAMLATYHLIAAIPDMVHQGFISADSGCPKNSGPISFLPNQPILSTQDLPWLIGTQAARKARFKFWNTILDRSSTLQWLLVNSFAQEYYYDNIKQQNQLTKSCQDCPFVIPIGPLRYDHGKNPSFWEEDMSCIEWLDKHKPNSVVYISFGSWVSPIGEEKIKNLAIAIEESGKPFIWVLPITWHDGLPNGYLKRVGIKQGKIVSWAPQIEILKHKSVGCYLTHCGWNSTLEAIEHRKRLLCFPVAGDQFVNCNFIVKVWKIGVRIYGFGKKEVEEGLKKVMEDSEMSKRLMRMHEMTMGDEAASRVGTNLTAFISDLNNIQYVNFK